MYNVQNRIEKERKRQAELKAAGKFPWTCDDAMVSAEAKLAVLAEEFGEVARAVCERDERNLAEELIQVAAVCVAWLEGMREVR